MGTYTTNYQLYMPTVGERGWGTLINGNYDAIDTAMKGLSNRITAVESEVNGALSCTSVTTSGTITSNGMLTANGGVNGGAITGTTITATNRFAGTLYGKVYVNAKTSTTQYNNDVTYATCAAQSTATSTANSVTEVVSSTITVGGYSKISLSYPYQLYPGIFIASSGYLTDSVPSSPSRTLTFALKCTTGVTGTSGSYFSTYLYVNGTQVYAKERMPCGTTYTTGQVITSTTYSVKQSDTVYCKITCGNSGKSIMKNIQASVSIPAASNYYINVV